MELLTVAAIVGAVGAANLALWVGAWRLRRRAVPDALSEVLGPRGWVPEGASHVREEGGRALRAGWASSGVLRVAVSGLPDDVALRRGQPAPEAELGDKPFDALWVVESGAGRLVAPVRDALVMVVRQARGAGCFGDAALEGGVLTVDLWASALREPRFARWMSALERVAAAVPAGDAMDALEALVHHDPVPEVRARALWSLRTRSLPRAEAVAASLLTPTALLPASLAMVVGLVLGRDDVLLSAIELPDANVPLATRVAQLYLERGGEVAAVISRLAAYHGPAGALAAASLSRERREGEPLLALIPGLVQWVEGGHAAAAGRALRVICRVIGEQRVPHAEPALLHALTVADADVLAEVVHALGVVGTVASVPALRALQKELWSSSALHGSIEVTVGAIQARAGGQRGALMEVRPEGGALTEPAVDARGRLTEEDNSAV